MTFRATQIGMFSCQRKTGVIVVEGCITPSTRIMAGSAVRTKLSVVFILISMTRITIRWCTLIYTVRMTCTTLGIRMFPRKREVGIVVVETHIRPPGRFMARTAIRSKLSVMVILIRVA